MRKVIILALSILAFQATAEAHSVPNSSQQIRSAVKQALDRWAYRFWQTGDSVGRCWKVGSMSECHVWFYNFVPTFETTGFYAIVDARERNAIVVRPYSLKWDGSVVRIKR